MKTIYKGEVWQGGMRVAAVEGSNYANVNRETAHYAATYAQDGEVEVRRYEKRPPKRWKRTS